MWRRAVAVLLALAACALAGCGSVQPAGETQTLNVYADISLKNVFEKLAEQFEQDRDVDVHYTFGDSAELVTRLEGGAPADLMALADVATMQHAIALSEGPWAGFAFNGLMIAVQPGNPADIQSFDDLTRKGVRTSICNPGALCGMTTRLIDLNAGRVLQPVSRRDTAVEVLDEVRSGAADAGLVFATDIAAAGETVEGIEFDESEDVRSIYSIAPLTADESDEPSELAMEFWDAVVYEPGQTLLTEGGFVPLEQPS